MAEVLHYLDFSFSVLFLLLWLWVQKKLHIFLLTVSERGKSLPVFDPRSQPKELFSNGALPAILVLHELVHTIQQVCFFTSNISSLSLSLAIRATGDFLSIVMHQSSMYEDQYFEGGHKRSKPIREERRDEV